MLGDAIKGLLAGGWTLAFGWIIPTSINLLIFTLFVFPALPTHIGWVHSYHRLDIVGKSLAFFAFAISIALILSMLRRQIYYILDGYSPPWPRSLAEWRKNIHRRKKAYLEARSKAAWACNDQVELDAADPAATPSEEAEAADPAGTLSEEAVQGCIEKCNKTLEDRLKVLHTKSIQKKLLVAKRMKYSKTDIAIQDEELRRYPSDDWRVLPTAFGNVQRRLEEYGSNIYKLDLTQLWYELYSAAPAPLQKAVDAARAGVDFFVCLLWGHLLVITASLVVLSVKHVHTATLIIVDLAMLVLACAWYRCAILANADYTAASRALVNLGRKPLAEAFGLALPAGLSQEREMWDLVSRLAVNPFESEEKLSGAEKLINPFRATSPNARQQEVRSAMFAAPELEIEGEGEQRAG